MVGYIIDYYGYGYDEEPEEEEMAEKPIEKGNCEECKYGDKNSRGWYCTLSGLSMSNLSRVRLEDALDFCHPTKKG